MKIPGLLLLAFILAGCTTTASHPNLKTAAGLPELIPVRDFVANRGSNFGYRISPDGKKLAWIAVKGVSLHIFIKDLERDTTHTLPAGNFYGEFEWAQDSRRIIFMLDSGDENTACVTLDTEQADDHPRWAFISPWGVKAQFARPIPNDPAHVLIAHNQRDKTVFDLFRVNIDTFQQTLIAKNPGNVTEWLTTPQGELKGRIVKQADASTLEILQPDAVSYKPLYQWSSSDKVQFVSIADTGAKLYLLSNKNRDRLALIELDTASGEERLVYDAPLVDVSHIYAHPLTGEPLIASTEPGYPEATILAPSLKASFGFLNNHPHARFEILGSDTRFRRLTLALSTEKGYEWYLYDMERDQLERLGATPSMAFKDTLADMTPIEIASRDNVTLRGYLTLPKGVPPDRLPMVLLVHGGPWERDNWRYNSEVQFLANRGYAVLQINYRGSTGYGRRFQELAVGEFASKMHDDLIDGIQWAINKGIADPDRIAIAGGSYGGYAALVGMSFTPERFACGIDLFGPTDLAKLLEDFPPYWKLEMNLWYRYVGDPGKPADRLTMQEKSPLYKADSITKPLLVIQGGHDVRVKPEQSIMLVNKLRQSGKTVDFWLVPDEGHGIVHWPHRLEQFRRTEDFLSGCLGGRSGGFDFYQLGAWLF